MTRAESFLCYCCNMTIEPVAFAVVRPFAARAARDRVSVSDTRLTQWFTEQLDGVILGLAGMIQIGSASRRIKGVWVEPACRGLGTGDRLARHLIALAQAECAAMIETLAYNPAYYIALGFHRVGMMPNGAVRLRRLL